MLLRCVFLFLISAITLSSIDCLKSSKSVQVLLQSKWPQTPLYLEAGEFLFEENSDYFWRYLDELHIENVTSLNESDQYQTVLQLASKLLRSESKLSILKFALSLRLYSPRVTVFQELIDDILKQYSHLCDDVFVEFSIPLWMDEKKRYSCAMDKSFIDNLESLLKKIDSEELDWRHPLIYSVDHVYSKTAHLPSSSFVVILYGRIGSPHFFSAHQSLKRLASAHSNTIRYVIRHFPDRGQSSKLALSGYGVELAIKSTEYKAQDDTRVRGEVSQTVQNLLDSDSESPEEISGFNFAKLFSLHIDLEDRLKDFRTYLMDQEKEVATLKVWELQEISLQAVTKVLSVQKEKALSVLKEISQNFPTVARSLVKIHVEPELKREISKNQNWFAQTLNLGTSDTALFINGLYNDIENIDVFALFETIRQELNIVERLHSLISNDTVDQERIKRFLKLDISWDRNSEFQLDFRDGAVQWVNDLESDRMYRNWPSSLQDMLRPTYPGMLRNIRRNMYHLVLILNPSKKDSFDMLRMAESFYIHKAPVRIGLVFDVEKNFTLTGYEEASVACLEAYNYLSQEKSPYEALSFLTDVIAYVSSGSLRDLRSDDVVSHFKSKFSKSIDLEDVFGVDSSYDTGRKLVFDFLERTGLEKGPKALMNGVLLKETQLNAEYFEEAVLSEIMRQTTPIQKAIYKSELNDGDDVLEWLMAKKTVMPRLNKVIFGLEENSSTTLINILDLASGHKLSKSSTDYFAIDINDLQSTMASSLKYLNTKKDCNLVTVWLVGDFSKPAIRTILSAALRHLRENSRSMRLALIFTEKNQFNRLVNAAIQSITNFSQLVQFLLRLTSSDQSDFEQAQQWITNEDYRKSFIDSYELSSKNEAPIFRLHQSFVNRVLKLQSSCVGVVLNGRVFSFELENSTRPPLIAEDFALIERFIQNLLSEKIFELLTPVERSSSVRECSDLVLKISAALLSKEQNTKQRYDISTNVNDDHSMLVLEPKNNNESFIELIAILDPLTRGAQKVSPILEVFHNVFNCRVRIYFNAVDKHSDMPLKLFYRFVLEREPRFDSKTGRLIAPIANFASMPKSPLFTLGMSVPENWLVEPVDSIYDLDNLHLEQVTSTNVVRAIFELEHLLVEGHCFEQSSGSPPRGLQFTLGTLSDPVRFDTIVMANLGYFQLKANPGIWLLRLRHGRSDEIYTISKHDGTDQTVNSTQVISVVSSFRSMVLKIRVNKKVGMQNEELLYGSDEAQEDSTGWFSWNSDNNKKKTSSDKSASAGDSINEDQDSKRINIFSVASGHLYERLLRIMMLSVLKHTKTKTKFWFLKNYLSPQFKQILPQMAKQYGLEYELVQYKWPRWLHQQTEKQRIIWGYKILFLDVLFPLDVKKIIFVDADQVVRTDLKELRDLDLEGAPYGYTPFCDSRKDMDGFRFWKQGYWATHLHGRRYHISALYVVDLQKFRRIAAGDRLRGQYQGLSQDPNSLSNLDQDLPNNMIHQVPIKSLPQEWLWCETWCDDDSKARAKTIDLCNNPKTKEPKLTAARRIVAEWNDYDQELKKLVEQVLNQSVASLNDQSTKSQQSKANEPNEESSNHEEL